MKKITQIIVLLLSVVVVMVVVYRLVNTAPSKELPINKQVVTIIDNGGCLTCHSTSPKVPFYSTWPIIGKMVVEDTKMALKQIDLDEVYMSISSGQPAGEVAMAKIEKSTIDGTMPPRNFSMVHWGSSITSAKKSILLEWIVSERATNYNLGLSSPEFANEPVQPIPAALKTDPDKVALGKALYNDTRLSSDNTVSCATCHGLNTGGVDNDSFSEGVGGALGGVNAPTVYNSVFNFVQFWDGRAATLALQAAGPPLNPVEMANKSFDDIVIRLLKDRSFTASFLKVYPHGYSEETITDAIAEYEKTLLTPDSRFDLYLKGDDSAITPAEKEGYRTFKKYECATCHTGVILGGQSYELIGLVNDYFADRGTELTVEDNGRFKETSIERDRHRFKVPGLRNVALTWPYFHDATQSTLEDAVRAMGHYQLGIEFTDSEVVSMVSFMNTLTGKFEGETLTNTNQKPELK